MASIRVTESVGKLVRASTATATFPASRINIGAQQFVTTSSLTLNTGVVGSGGVDASVQASKLYYVYVVLSNGAPALIASTNSILPAGYTQARIVGYFLTNASSQIQWANATILPSVTVLTSGSGSYTAPAGCTSIRVRMAGAGGGGAGGGGGGNGTAGGTTTFGTSLLTAVGGNAAVGVDGGTGGAVTVISPANDSGSVPGSRGGPGNSVNVTAANARILGGYGAPTRFSGPSAGGNPSSNGTGDSGAVNSGAGGAGGGSPSAGGGVQAGGGGGSGGQVDAIVPAPLATSYAYSIGTGGTAGTAGASAYAGGSGGSGIIIIDESYT